MARSAGPLADRFARIPGTAEQVLAISVKSNHDVELASHLARFEVFLVGLWAGSFLACGGPTLSGVAVL
jgi:hypothetical protein